MNANLMGMGDDKDVVDLEWPKYQPCKIYPDPQKFRASWSGFTSANLVFKFNGR